MKLEKHILVMENGWTSRRVRYLRKEENPLDEELGPRESQLRVRISKDWSLPETAMIDC
jgi:hypothetical protein